VGLLVYTRLSLQTGYPYRGSSAVEPVANQHGSRARTTRGK
jgi:hypothetical protein